MITRNKCLLYAALALISLAAPARAQFSAYEPAFRGGVSVGAFAGQTVRIRIEAADASTASLVKVFDGATGALLRSYELAAGRHTININRDELPAAGGSDTGRVWLWIALEMAARPVVQPVFELVDNDDGKATVHGTIPGNTYMGVTTVYASSLTLGSDQTLNISLPGSFLFGDGSVRSISYSVYVYDAAGNLLHQTERVVRQHELGHLLGFRHEHTRPEAASGPKEVWIEIESTTWSTSGQAVEGARLPPTFEVSGDADGPTTISGVLPPAGRRARD
jgi:hypothetical protein